jgi:PAS domain S-box-containing protein/putative nucleotidyltransferase with HDIG domain
MSRKISVLIVEDSEGDALLVIRQFKKAGYDIISKRVETAYQMQTALADAPWDLVISDYNLPEFDAPSALIVLQKSGLDVPFIVVSGVIGEDTAVSLMKNGANDYIMKGNLARLVPAVIRELDEVRTRRAKQQAEEQLKESEERFRSIYENSVDAILFAVPDGDILAANPAACRMFGRSEEEIRQVGRDGIIDHSDERFLEANQERKKTDISFEKEYFHIRKDGTRFPTEVSSSIFLDKDGRVKSIVIIRDVTRRKEAEQKLKESEERMRLTFEALDEGVWDWHILTGKTFFSSRCYTMLGYEDKEFPDTFQSWQSLFDPDDTNRIAKTIKERLKTGKRCAVEVRARTKTGNWRWIETRGKVVERDDKGRAMRMVGIHSDITERKEAGAKLLESEERYRTAIEYSNDGIGLVKEGKHIYVNKKLLEMFGYETPDDLVGKPTTLVVHPDYHEELDDYGQRQGKGKPAPEQFEFRGVKKDGSVIFVEASVTKTVYHGEQVLFVFSRDITSRKKAEEELAGTAEKLRKSLAGTLQAMAHTVEIRDPYTAGHEKRVSALARSIAQEMDLSKEVANTIRMAGSIHDIGKMSVPAEILSKPTRLLDLEMNLIKIHSQAGYDILKDSQLPYPVAEIVLQHHERLDGSGYPQGLKGDQILLEAQIMAVADTVEAMASHRPYRPALGIDAALEEIEKNKGILYNVAAVEACLRLFKEKGFEFP